MKSSEMNIARKLLICLLVFVFVLMGCTPPADNKVNNKIKSGRDITIYVATDPHYLSDSLTDHGKAFKNYVYSGDGKQMEYMDEILSAFAYNIHRTKPNILIVSGDLTNNGEKKSHLDFAKKLEDIEKGGTSVYVIPGNHDISNPWARGFKGDEQYVTGDISQKDFSQIYRDFGYSEAVQRDRNTLSYLVEPSPDLWLLMLDTIKYKNNYSLGSPETDGELSKGTLNWIEKCSALAKEKGAKIITVMHHNLVNHSAVIREGFTLNNSKEVLKVFKDNNLDIVLSGHIHIQDISSDSTGGRKLYDIATGSLAVNPHQFGIIRFSPGRSSLDYNTSSVDVEGWAKDKGIKNKDLNNFKKYSEEYFGNFAYDMACRYLLDNTKYSKDQIKTMSETMEILNIRYFAGRENLNSKDVKNSAGFKLWMSSPQGFFKNYALSMISDKDTDDNHLHVELLNK